MKCVILQPSYIPWRGYFDQISRADVFVFYDDVQFDKGGWRHRNQIYTQVGPKWLSIPVKHKGHLEDGLQVKDILIDWNTDWISKHWRSICQNYSKSPFFKETVRILQPFYESRPKTLCELVIPMTIRLSEVLGFETTFLRSSEMNVNGGKTERLVKIVQAAGCSEYLSGPSARDYIDESIFAASEITLEYVNYNYPEYPQLRQPFQSQLSIIDLLFMTGPNAANFI